MTILVTGSNGFIGSHLVTYLRSAGHIVFQCDRKHGSEVCDIDSGLLAGKDFVVHLAAQTSVWNQDEEQVMNDNVTSFWHILKLCRDTDTPLIFASSSCAHPNNITSLYGATKQFNELMAKIIGWKRWYGVRLHNVYGNNQRQDTLLAILLKSEQTGVPVKLYNGGMNTRHFTHISDVCLAFRILIEQRLPYGMYNVTNPESNTTLGFAEQVKKLRPNVKFELVDEIREKDKTLQNIDFSLSKVLYNYKSIKEGLQESLT